MRRRTCLGSCLALAALLGAALVHADESSSLFSAVSAKVQAALPDSWSVAERTSGVLPVGHYWGQAYAGELGDELVLQGNADVYVTWQDTKGEWHRDAVGKEALRLYVMPPTYRESWLRFMIPKRPAAARLLVDAQTFKIYAQPTFRIVDNGKYERIVKQGKMIRWPDSPEHTEVLSWNSWSADIPRVLKGP